MKIHICPKCFNYRIVSRRITVYCYHCGELTDRSELEYEDYIRMTLEEREKFKQKYKARMLKYREKIDSLTNKDDKKDENTKDRQEPSE